MESPDNRRVADDSYRALERRYEIVSPDRCPAQEGTMLRLIPLDVWAAAAIAVVGCIVEIFDPAPAIFIVIYLGLRAFIAAQTIGDELG